MWARTRGSAKAACVDAVQGDLRAEQALSDRPSFGVQARSIGKFWAQCNRAVTTENRGHARKAGMTKPPAISRRERAPAPCVQCSDQGSASRFKSRKAAKSQDRMPINTV